MDYEKTYQNSKDKLLNDLSICNENKTLFKRFLDWEEVKLKRINNLPRLDDSCYKTLGGYIGRFRNVNLWFNNKPWVNLTKKDIERVYNDLEDGKIKNKHGERFGDLKSYYGKVFRSKPFEMAGKTHFIKEVMEFSVKRDKEDVRFIVEQTLRDIEQVIVNPEHKALTWLAFDIGENVNTLLQLKKNDFFRQINPDTKEPEYRVNLPKDKLKRTRQTRSEITNFIETVQLLDNILQNLKDDEKIFNFEYRAALKFLDRAVKITGAKCIPKGQKVSWKDLRSSMSCDLLSKGWSLEEVNARLGHKPSSREIDKYVNFLAIGRHKPKQKIYNHNLEKLQDDFNKSQDAIKLQGLKVSKGEEEMKTINQKMESLILQVEKLKMQVAKRH